MNKVRQIINRIYSDYVMPSRFHEYEKFLKYALNLGYSFSSVIGFYDIVKSRKLSKKDNIIILRHDIDSDIEGAREFHKIEMKYGIVSSYYFRLSTLDFFFMKDIIISGGEASYHFEEIADFCKVNRISDKRKVLREMDKIRQNFALNFSHIENKLSVKLRSVASHGDFVNRKLRIINNEITKDINLRKYLGIELEAYDNALMKEFDIYISDRSYPIFWFPESPFRSVNKFNIICILTHPRQWRRNFYCNIKQDLKRSYEELLFKLYKISFY
jgi:hypothetical protein